MAVCQTSDLAITRTDPGSGPPPDTGVLDGFALTAPPAVPVRGPAVRDVLKPFQLGFNLPVALSNLLAWPHVLFEPACTLARKRIAGVLSRPSYGLTALRRGPNGDCCQPNTGTGTASTNDSPVGLTKASGHKCINIRRCDDADLEYLIIDSTVVRAHPCAAGAPPKRVARRPRPWAGAAASYGFSTKIHVSVNIAATAWATPCDSWAGAAADRTAWGQQHDITQAEELIAGYAGEHVLADQGYDAQEFRQHILELGMMPVIPPRSNRKAPADYDRHLYRERHLVECFINKIKHYRRIFSRFEKLDTRYLGFLHFTAALIWLR